MGLLKSIICCVQAVFQAMFGELAEHFKGIEDIKGIALGKTKKEIAFEKEVKKQKLFITAQDQAREERDAEK